MANIRELEELLKMIFNGSRASNWVVDNARNSVALTWNGNRQSDMRFVLGDDGNVYEFGDGPVGGVRVHDGLAALIGAFRYIR